MTALQRVWVYTASLAVVTAVGLGVFLTQDLAVPRAYDLPWWVVLAVTTTSGVSSTTTMRRGVGIDHRPTDFFSAVAVLTLPVPTAVVVLAGSELLVQTALRKEPTKQVYNVVATALATLMAAVAVQQLPRPDTLTDYALLAVAGAATAAVVSTVATTVIIGLASGTRPATGAALRDPFHIAIVVLSASLGGATVSLLRTERPLLALLPLVTLAAIWARDLHAARQATSGTEDELRALSDDDTGDRLTRLAVDLTGARHAVLVRADPPTIVSSATWGEHDEPWDLPGAAASLLEAHDDVARIDDRGTLARELGAHQVMSRALRRHGELVGVLALLDHHAIATHHGQTSSRHLDELTQSAAALLGGGDREQVVRDLQDRLDHHAHHDPLTGALNRQGLVDALEDEGLSTLLLLDVVAFARWNDRLGYDGGDALLRELSLRLATADHRVARLDGDRFAVACATSTPDVVADVERTLARGLGPYLIDGHRIDVAFRAGYAHASDTGGRGLLGQAELALQESRDRGDGPPVVWTPDLARDRRERRQLADDLRRAIDGGGLRVALQPLVSLEDDQIVGSEALVRWDRPGHGPVRPDHFIPIAEADGMIVALGRVVLEEACRQTARLRAVTGRDLYVSVNVAAPELDDTFPSHVERTLQVAGLPADRLVLELTERALVADIALAVRVLGELRRTGVRVAIDDFGTGWSSLASLQRLPVDVVKIPREFVERITAPDGGAIVDAVVGIAHALDLALIAEGVETREQAEAVRRAGCGIGQGWLWSPGVPPEELQELVGRSARLSA